MGTTGSNDSNRSLIQSINSSSKCNNKKSTVYITETKLTLQEIFQGFFFYLLMSNFVYIYMHIKLAMPKNLPVVSPFLLWFGRPLLTCCEATILHRFLCIFLKLYPSTNNEGGTPLFFEDFNRGEIFSSEPLPPPLRHCHYVTFKTRYCFYLFCSQACNSFIYNSLQQAKSRIKSVGGLKPNKKCREGG